jgi:MoaA/NifB/PqqE/SkfB family radical SAM enzyme
VEDPDRQYRDRFDHVIASTLRTALRLTASDPALVLAGAKILYHQRRAAALRKDLEGQGILVPAVMMISLTSRCNLACAGCYQRAQHRDRRPEMTGDQVGTLVAQAADLGVSVIVFAGGEPLLRSEEILRLAGQYPQVLLVFFTNGLLIDKTKAVSIAGHKNLIPVISFEGFRVDTDRRRGSGVFDRLLTACSLLHERNVFFGCSITVTRSNVDHVLGDAFIRQMMEAGVRVFVFVEYVPIEAGTEDLVLAGEQREVLRDTLLSFSQTYSALFIGFPGDEDPYGGCLAAGRGFVHVSSSGDLEPCPAAPFSDRNLTTTPLKEAFRSGLLEKIRLHHELLTETSGGCALWANREWVQALIRQRTPKMRDNPEKGDGQ